MRNEGMHEWVQRAVRRGAARDPWLVRMPARRPRMLVAVSLANRMATPVNQPTARYVQYATGGPAKGATGGLQEGER